MARFAKGVQLPEECAEYGRQQDRLQHGSLTLGAWGTLNEVAGDTAFVVTAVGMSCGVMVMGRVAAAGLHVVLHADVSVGMVMMGKDGHSQHDDADHKKQVYDVLFLFLHTLFSLMVAKIKVNRVLAKNRGRKNPVSRE